MVGLPNTTRALSGCRNKDGNKPCPRGEHMITVLEIKINTELGDDDVEKIRELIEDNRHVQILEIDSDTKCASEREFYQS